jgi:hypothetical protein
VLDSRIAQKFPLLAKAIAAEQILDVFMRDNKLPDVVIPLRKYQREEIPVSKSDEKIRKAHFESEEVKNRLDALDFNLIFDMIDTDHSNFINLDELLKLFKDVGAEVTADQVKAIIQTDDDGRISRDEFNSIMTSPLSKKH